MIQVAGVNLGIDSVLSTKYMQSCLGSNLSVLIINSTCVAIPNVVSKGYIPSAFDYVSSVT